MRFRNTSRRRRQFGLTLVELIVAFTIMMLLTSLALPLARFRVHREKERELRYSLRELRTAIDKYKDLCDKGTFGPNAGKLGTDCYPETLDQMVEGVKIANDANGKKIRFLRRVPRDPFTNSRDWGMRSSTDDPKSTGWGGQNVFDVFTKSMEKAPDGTAYSEW
jgi:general secretion pathway protein G